MRLSKYCIIYLCSQVCHSEAPLGDDVHFTVLHSRAVKEADKYSLHCLFMHIDKSGSGDGNSSAFHAVLEWVTFSTGTSQLSRSNTRSSIVVMVNIFIFAVDEKTWVLERVRRLKGDSCPDYAALDHMASNVLISSQKPYVFEYDSVVPVVMEPEPAKQGKLQKMKFK